MARHSNYSPTGESKTGIISRLETVSNDSYSLPEEPRTGIVSRLETQQGTAGTHFLECQGQASSAGLKHSKAQ
jgi:hypothetical protein